MSDDLSVRPVDGRRDLRSFVDLPYRLHGDSDAFAFVPPLRMSEFETLDPDRNPFFEHARVTLFLAEREGVVVGRIAAIDDDNHNATHDDNLIFFGFFEAADEATAHALLARVEAEAANLGRDAVRGPANPSLNDSAGLQLDAYDRPAFVMMPQNPPDYVEWVARAGYEKVKDLYAWMVHSEGGMPERFARLARRVRDRTGAVVRNVDMDAFDEELSRLKMIYSRAWERNWGQVAYTEAEFDHLAKNLRMILDPRTVQFLEIDGDTAGVAVGIPDLNQVLAKFNGRLFPTGIFHLLRRTKIIDQVRVAILGVLPEYRNRGFELVLIDEFWRRAVAAGYPRAEMSWILEDNEGINKALRAIGGDVYKRYRIFEKSV